MKNHNLEPTIWEKMLANTQLQSITGYPRTSTKEK
jgi:hypothetical protein